MCDFANADTFLRSAPYSVTSCYKPGRLHQLLTSQEDAEGGAIIFIFKKAGAYRVDPTAGNLRHWEAWSLEGLARLGHDFAMNTHLTTDVSASLISTL